MPSVLVNMRISHWKSIGRLSREYGSRTAPGFPTSRLLLVLLLVLVVLTSFVALPLVMQRPRCVPQRANGFLWAWQGELVDSACQEVQLTGVNWSGMETGAFAPGGLDVRNWQQMLDQMVQAGFNTVRLPFSSQFFDPTSLPQGINYQKNPDLRGLRGLSLLDRLIEGARQRGLKVILDRHRPTAWAQSDLWYTDEVPESEWISDWVMLARHYRGNDTVIGADLDNEPRGAATWGTGDLKTDWRLAAERAGNAILAVNPDWLIIVEGIEQYQGDYYWWGGNLEGAAQYPVRLSQPDKLVYSTHDYGPEVYPQPWFWASDFPQNLIRLWEQHWAYLQLEGQTPVLVGEFGARSVGPGPEGVWLRQLLTFMKAYNFSYTYWAWNPDSEDTGGLLEDDWKTLDQAKLASVSSYQCPLLNQQAAASRSAMFRNQPVTPALFGAGRMLSCPLLPLSLRRLVSP